MTTQKSKKPVWKQAVAKYRYSDTRISIWQLINSLVPYFVLLYVMYRSLEVSYLLTLLLAVPAGLFAVRIFIIFHDCGHGSFFKSRRANDIVGIITGILTFTPYYYWRHTHAVHHATSGDLDRRGTGDVWMMTVQEYIDASPRKRRLYRIFRHPLLLFGVGPWILFLVNRRFVDNSKARTRERRSVYLTNLALLAILIVATLTIGFWQYILVQLPVIMIASSVGVWMFYIQHQFEGVYFARHEDWDYVQAALEGSSYYKLPKVLQWFTGNIGFHHIHHLSPRIPNYHLEQCHNETPLFQESPTLTLWESFKAARFRLWDEERGELVDLAFVRRLERQLA